MTTNLGCHVSFRESLINSKLQGYTILETIGHGAYGTVFRAHKDKDKSQFVAVKCFEKGKLSQPERIDTLITEIKMLKMLHHPNIVEMKAFLWDDRFVYIIEEFCDGGDLSKFIHQRQKLPEPVFQKFLQQLAMGLYYLRQFNICHLDLKPSNLLIVTKPDLTLKIGDFGFAQHLSNETYQGALRGSPLYMAPEMLLRRRYDAKVDLWSVGIISYECLFGKAPFSSCNFKELRDKLLSETPIEIKDIGLSRQCQELLRRLLKYNPDERIDYEQFFSHPFVDVVHQPSPKTYAYAVELLHKAVKQDSEKNFKESFGLYCDALAYLIPHVHAEKDEARKEALQNRLTEYMDRSEHLLAALKVQQYQSAPSIEDLKTLCSSTPPLVHAVEMGFSAQMYLAEGNYHKAMETFYIALETLVDFLPKEPSGNRKNLLLKQTSEWVTQATRCKALYDMRHIQAEPVDVSEVKDLCVLQ